MFLYACLGSPQQIQGGLASPFPIILVVVRFSLDLAFSMPSSVLRCRCPGGGFGFGLHLDFDLDFQLASSLFLFSAWLVLSFSVLCVPFAIMLVFLVWSDRG